MSYGDLYNDADAYSPSLDEHILLTERYRAEGNLDAALRMGQKGVDTWPRSSRMRCALGFLNYDRNDLDGAVEQFEKLIELYPDDVRAHVGLGTSLLARGDWARGWKEFRWRLRLPGFASVVVKDKPYWNGQFVDSLLLVGEGFGDTIQFLRYVCLARLLCKRLVIICRAEIQSLVEANVKDCVITSNWSDIGDCDAYCVFTDLSGFIEKTPSFSPVKYMHADDSLVRTWSTILGTVGAIRVGLFWAGNPTHFNDFRRSILLDRLLPLTDISGISLVGLQKGVFPGKDLPFPNFGDEFVDWMDTASFMENLDLVVSVDSAVAHLAGALGKPAWTLLPYASEWRWMQEKETTHWYPSMRLFRQSKPGDWEEVIEKVSCGLRKIVENRNGDRHLSIGALQNAYHDFR